MYATDAMFKYLMAQPSRLLTTRGTITYPDAATQALTAEEISSISITEDAGAHLPLGGVSASSLTLTLDNREGEWNPGGSILGSHSLDGAVINLEVGVGHPDYTATPETVDGGAPDETFASSYDGGASGEVFTAELDGGEPDTFVDEYYWANIGTYIIEEPTAQEQQTIITLKGADILANAALTAFTDGQTYPRTVLQILQYACTQAGITLKTTTFTNSTQSIATKPSWEPETTCRDIIGYVACLAAGFARIDRDGELEIIGFERNAAGDIDDLLNSYFTYTDGILTFNSDDTILTLGTDGADLTADPDGLVTVVGSDLVVTAFYDGDRYYVYPSRYKTLTRQGAIFGPFNALSVYEFGAPNGYGATRIADDTDIEDNELNSVAVQGNPLLAYELCDTLMANMLTALSGLTFYGGSIAWQGDPTITCGDFVDVYSLNNEAIPLLVLNQTLTFGPGFGMSSGNQLNTATKGKAKTEYMRVFTPTGKLNAAALDGDINIRAGRQLNLLAGANMVLKAGGVFTLDSGNLDIDEDGNVTLIGEITANSGKIGGTGGFTIASQKLYSGKSTLTGTDAGVYLGTDGISLGSAGVAPQFKVTAEGALTASGVTLSGSITSSSGSIGGFTIGATSLTASPSGKPVLELDTANSEINLGDMTIFYSGSSWYEINVGANYFGLTTSDFLVGGAYAYFEVKDAYTWCNGDMSALTFTDRP